jgi:hypothetical protein
VRAAGEGYRAAGAGRPPANPGRRCRLGRTGVANLNCALPLLFLLFPSTSPCSGTLAPLSFASPDPLHHRTRLHRPAPGTSTACDDRQELSRRAVSHPRHSAPKRRRADASTPSRFHVQPARSCSFVSPLVLAGRPAAASTGRAHASRARSSTQGLPYEAGPRCTASTRPDPGRTSAYLFPYISTCWHQAYRRHGCRPMPYPEDAQLAAACERTGRRLLHYHPPNQVD